MQYEALLARLYACHAKGLKHGLKNIQELASRLKSPHLQVLAVHVAGTNGKGSVVTKIAAALHAEGLRVGLYTSPHISSFRERIRINGECIAVEEVARHLQEIFAADVPATFFEYTTMLAYIYFAKKNVDIAVLETGLGGRLDATNICQSRLSVITSISLDHTRLLGTTVEAIAKEKAGIIKPGVPVVIGPRVPLETIRSFTDSLQAPLYVVDHVAQDFEEENQQIARKALELLGVSQSSITKGLEAVPPCRFERVNQVILDVAHNPDGIKQLIKRLKATFGNRPLYFLCGFSKDKNVDDCLQLILQEAAGCFFVQAASPRAMPAERLLQKAKGHTNCFAYSDIKMAMHQAIRHAGQSAGILVICGSFFIMSDCRELLGIKEPRDRF